MSCSWLPPLRLDVVDVRVLALPDRLHDLADVHAVLDHRVANGHVLQRHLVADWNILPAFELEVRSSSRMRPVSVVPARMPSTTTTATESPGSCNTQWITGVPGRW